MHLVVAERERQTDLAIKMNFSRPPYLTECILAGERLSKFSRTPSRRAGYLSYTTLRRGPGTIGRKQEP